MSEPERRAILTVKRGLYTLTYRFDPLFQAAPVASIESASQGIYLVSPPGEAFGVLSQPGSGMVVLAEADGTLELVVRAALPGGSLSAEIELTRVEAARPAAAIGEAAVRPPLPEGGSEFLVRAHVSLRGDISAHRGHWICGPDTPGRIEGFELRGGGPLPLEYQVATAGRTGGWSAWFPAGTYAGSRGKALPLIGVRIRLKPEAAPNLVLRGEGLFLGTAPVARSGREIELVGPSPLDPLVGLRLDFTTAGEMLAAHTASEDASGRGASRMRVFRRTAAQQSEAA